MTSTQQKLQISTKRAKVILCAGTIGTASIALNSGLQFHEPLVGKGLIDHAVWGVRFARRSNPRSRDPIILQCTINICGTTALLTVTVNANFLLSGSSSLPIQQYLERDGTLIPPAKGRVDIKEKDFDTTAILLEFGAELDEKNEVLNIASPTPVIRVRRQNTYSDEKFQLEMQKLVTLIQNTEFIGSGTDLASPGLNLPPAPRLSLLGFGVFSHEVGTMRMNGAGGRPGVVDENLQVNGFSNLHVCDLSVLPYSPPANPTLTLAALSLRLADHLATLSRPGVVLSAADHERNGTRNCW